MIFQDKKVVTNLKQERFANTPAYKTAIAEWEIHCNNKTYRLSSLQLFDTKNTEISTQNYTASSLRPMSILSGTLTEKQYETVCGKNSDCNLYTNLPTNLIIKMPSEILKYQHFRRHFAIP